MRYNLLLGSVYFICLISFFFICCIFFYSCNKELADFEDKFDQQQTQKAKTIITSIKPKIIRHNSVFQSDSLNYQTYKLFYSLNYSGLEYISSDVGAVAWYSKHHDTIFCNTIDQSFYNYKILNNRIVSLGGGMFEPNVHHQFYYYDSLGYLSKVINDLDSTFYYYNRGNLDSFVSIFLDVDVYRKITYKFEYDENIKAGINEYLFTLFPKNDPSLTGGFSLHKFLDVNGSKSINLPKKVIIDCLGLKYHVQLDYYWQIENSFVKELTIKDGHNVISKTKFEY